MCTRRFIRKSGQDPGKRFAGCLAAGCLCLFLWLYGGWAAAQTTSSSFLREARSWYPRYVTFLPAEKMDSVPVYADTDIVPIIYKVNKWDTKPGVQVDTICRLIDAILSDRRVRMAYVWVGGSASPEGPVAWNRRLGCERADVLAAYLLANSHLTPDHLRVENLEEDWQSVVHLLAGMDFPHKELIIDIIRTESDPLRRKSKIRAIDSGRTWHRLIREVFPPLRNARMVIVCHTETLDTLANEPVAPPPVTSVWSVPCLSQQPPVRPPEYRFVALKTNALFLAALTANLGVEVELMRKWSLDFPVWYSPYDITPTRKLRLLAIQPELRYWTRKAGKGHFFGLHTYIVGFNVAINDHGRYRVVATDVTAFLRSGGILEDVSVKVVYKQYVAVGYNVATCDPNRFVGTYSVRFPFLHADAMGDVGEDAEGLLFGDYLFTSSGQETLVLADFYFYDATGGEINRCQGIEIPLKRNRETVIRGAFLTHEVSRGNDIAIDENFEDEFTMTVE